MRIGGPAILRQNKPQIQSRPQIRQPVRVVNPIQKVDSNVKLAMKEVKQNNLTMKQEKQIEKKKFETMNSEQLIQFAFNEFKNTYNNKVKRTSIKEIVNGEVITTDERNIFVNEDLPPEDDDEVKKFEKKMTLCTKKLYSYQINAIKKIRQLECSNHYVCKSTNEHIRSNGWLLHLPIGSGKSLVFTFIALLYRNVPANPIIISTSGVNVPETERVQLKYYPFYYENVGYIEGKENSVTCMKDYKQRQMTVIITHYHLLDQLHDYINTDFRPELLKRTRINFVRSIYEMKLDCDILVVPAKLDIIQRLVNLSYDSPFMRVIVDDYTSMPNVDEYRQILASSTLLVSGSGFERDKSKIPPSYYTLRHIEVDKYSLVAKQEETMKGILRDSVATFNLMGSETIFSTYKFVDEIDQYLTTKYKMVSGNIYEPIIKNGGMLKDYLALSFIIKNFDRFNTSIHNMEEDLKNGKLNANRVKYYLEWKKTVNKMSKEIIINQDKKQEIKMVDNPFLKELMTPNGQTTQVINPLVQQLCQVCGKGFHITNGWGFVSTCCGSFFCVNCAKNMATHSVVLRENDTIEDLKHIYDNLHCYCVVCHKCDPKYFVNCSKHKNAANVQAHSIISNYLIADDLKNSANIDYMYYMFLNGFKNRYSEGKTIYAEMEEVYDKNDLINPDRYHNLIPTLYPRDRLAIIAIDKINDILNKLEIKPIELNSVKPCVLIYDCPEYIQKRIQSYFAQFSKNKSCSLYGLDLVFKKDMGSLIGLHRNILAILVWNEPRESDEIHQLIGRILRLNTWNNPLYFYITCKDSNMLTQKIENNDEIHLGETGSVNLVNKPDSNNEVNKPDSNNEVTKQDSNNEVEKNESESDDLSLEL